MDHTRPACHVPFSEIFWVIFRARASLKFGSGAPENNWRPKVSHLEASCEDVLLLILTDLKWSTRSKSWEKNKPFSSRPPPAKPPL